jgi:hypothetical protein
MSNLSNWSEIINKSADDSNNKSKEWIENNPPLEEIKTIEDDREITIGLWFLNNQWFYSQKYANGYRAEMLIGIPKVVTDKIFQIEKI